MKKASLCRNCSDKVANDGGCGWNGDDFCTYKCQCDYWGVKTEEDIKKLIEADHKNDHF